MAGVKSRSLHDLLVVLLVSALGGLAVVAVTVHHWLVGWQMRRLVDQQATTLAKLLGGQARRMLLANDRAGLKRWAREVSGQGSIVAAAVFGPAGAAQAIGYTDRAWLSYFEAPWANDDGAWAPGQASKLQQVSGQRGSVYRLDVPIRASMGGQRIGMVSILWRPDAGGLIWLFGLVIAAASVVAFGLLWWRLGRRLLEPLEVLGRAALTGAQPPVNLPAELRGLAGLVGRLQEEMRSWQGRAELLERTVDTRVAARTRAISVALRRAERRAWLDPLTGVTNRRFIDEKLPEIFEAQAEAGQDLSLVMLDLDDFKALNDRLGHQAGDELLCFAGRLLQGAIRDSDIAARYGGDEFMLILPAVSLAQAEAVAQRAVALFAQQAGILGRGVCRPSLSAGIASLASHQPGSLAGLIRLADEALYRAKHSEQHVCVAGLQPVAEPTR